MYGTDKNVFSFFGVKNLPHTHTHDMFHDNFYISSFLYKVQIKKNSLL